MLHLLYGYAKLAGMDDGVLNVLFTDEDDLKDIAAIRALLGESQINVELMKHAVPLLAGGGNCDEEAFSDICIHDDSNRAGCSVIASCESS